jgi:cyclic pyranopterin phosphate synthase
MCGGNLGLVLRGIEECLVADLTPVKVNVVLVKGKNDDEIDDFIELTRDLPIDVRFIELMPLGELGQDESLRMNNVRFIEERPYLIPLEPRYRGQPSQDFRVEGYKGRVGFISPHSRKFCDLCNRVRVMSDGKLRMCLGNNHEISLMEALEEQDDKALIEIIRDAIYNKPEGHHFDCDFVSDKNMRRIGG